MCRDASARARRPEHRSLARSRAAIRNWACRWYDCRPFAPDGEFRHVPSPGQLKLRIRQSVATWEEVRRRARVFPRRHQQTASSVTSSTSAYVPNQFRSAKSFDRASVADKSRGAHARESYSLLSAEYHVQSATLAGKFGGIRQLALDLQPPPERPSRGTRLLVKERPCSTRASTSGIFPTITRTPIRRRMELLRALLRWRHRRRFWPLLRS
jgi:hypothetical protein